jgi:hypothetical protein
VTAACDTGPEPVATGSFSGQVVVSGPLRGANVTVDQLDASDPAMGSLFHVAGTTSDDQGRFSVDVGIRNRVLLITATGGSFVDSATGATILLDLLDTRDDALVSPIGHLIVARTPWKAAGEFHDAPRPLDLAEEDAAKRLGRHFGNVDWTRQKLASLEVVAISPTEPVRAALVQAALSELAHDIAIAAGASLQEVNVLRLTKQLAVDMGQGTFDGNDHNSWDFTQGLQLGVCVPVAGCTVPQGSCTVGACRPLCDLYAGTPPGAMAYVRGVVAVKVKAIDDTDPRPQVWIDDRAPTGSTAEAAIDTTAINGPLVVTATVNDMAGNVTSLPLPPVTADNIAPTLTFAPDGFFVDGSTWWTPASAPVLAGTVTDASPVTVTATTQAGAGRDEARHMHTPGAHHAVSRADQGQIAYNRPYPVDVCNGSDPRRRSCDQRL